MSRMSGYHKDKAAARATTEKEAATSTNMAAVRNRYVSNQT